MNAKLDDAWRAELGIASKRSRHFFANVSDLEREKDTAPQAHVIRRAFQILELDGVVCSESAPLVYFKRAPVITTELARRLHRDFWNHGGAPILVLIGRDSVHVYSGLSRPTNEADVDGHAAGFVVLLERASDAIREFLPSVESGEFFHRHAQSFDPKQRVDRHLLDNLQGTREELVAALRRDVNPDALDGLLCRLVFTCYLFDRGVIDAAYLKEVGIHGAVHLRDVLAARPRSVAKANLYGRLFKSLGEDFNGELFSDDLNAEASLVAAKHLDLLEGFFRGTEAKSGQQSFWPYNFGVIPIETISAIYERFLKPSDKEKGAFYTPRFLAEVVLDSALMRTESLVGKRYLDPACGSGVFLVGVFNRIAEEWNQANPTATNDVRARELLRLLRESVFGIDVNPTACRITAFSLYLAYLDQLSPRGIREIQAKKGALPKLVAGLPGAGAGKTGRNIWVGDFFADDDRYPVDVDFVLGNPPWGGIAGEETAAAGWCAAQIPPVAIPDKQIAAAFMRKGPMHLVAGGRVCFVLPSGTLFNHGKTAIEFQRTLFEGFAVDRVLNLADYQRFLFEEAGHPAVVIDYRVKARGSSRDVVEYWAPKADWMVTRAEVITVGPEDRSTFGAQDVLSDLRGADAPQIWKRRMWATPRDWRLLDRLSTLPRLRDRVRRAKERAAGKPWVMAEGFQPVGKGDVAAEAMGLLLPSKNFIRAKSSEIDLFLLEKDFDALPVAGVMVRSGSNKRVNVFRGPHVLVAKGFTSTAFTDADVSFQHALRGISGPPADRELLIFLAAYLRSRLARYFLFHTSSNWGVSRQEVHVEELLRLPFPVPEAQRNRKEAWRIVREVVRLVDGAASEAAGLMGDRAGIVAAASRSIEPLIEQYFDVLPVESPLIEDTVRVIIPSVRPTQRRPDVPTIMRADGRARGKYVDRLCGTLNRWARRTGFAIKGIHAGSEKLGIGVAVLQRSRRGEGGPVPPIPADILEALDKLRKTTGRKLNAFEFARGVKAFQDDLLYVVKPLGQRHWTETAALNDADEIAGTILMQSVARVRA